MILYCSAFALLAPILGTIALPKEFDCSGDVKLGPADRVDVLNEHNHMRSQIALGTAKRHNGLPNMPRGKNIYELEWDCGLEVEAQKWADRCKFEESPKESRNAGEMVYELYSTSLPYGTTIRLALSMYEMEAENPAGIPGPSNILTHNVSQNAGHWAQIVWGKTTKLGCGAAKCGKTSIIVCRYQVSSKTGEQIYELGNGCTKDSDCTTFAGSTCHAPSSLCLAPGVQETTVKPTTAQTEKPVQTTAGAQVTEAPVTCAGGILSSIERAAVLNRHNYYRSELARGTAGYGAPGGKNIHQLAYDCDLEKTAQQYADTCPYLTHSGMKGIGENIFYSSDRGVTTEEYLLLASDMWWNELRDNGYIGNIFTNPFNGKHGTLGHWSQMAWGKTSKLGCGIKKCSYGISVICQYLKAANLPGAPIYELGANGCNQDSDCKSKKCNAENGLCILTGPLCEDRYSNCKELEPYCNRDTTITEGCAETCKKC